MIKLDHVSKVYKVGTFGSKELRAVNDVCFEIQDREIVSLIGESGSGKSTIGKMILRLISISAGRIYLEGKDIREYSNQDTREYYRKVQGVFQDPFSSFNPIYKADRLFATIHEEFYPGLPDLEWEKKIDSSLRSVGLNPEHVLNKYPHQLSGGQLQRFLIARALLLDIKFLVADEIISMLDASTRIDVLNLLAELKNKGLSILFITHDINLANYISERAIILFRGCVVEIGPTDLIFNNPQHPYTIMLMNSVPRTDRKWDESEAENEEERKDNPSGCSYYTRCLLAEEKCSNRKPDLVEIEAGHFVSCFLTSPG